MAERAAPRMGKKKKNRSSSLVEGGESKKEEDNWQQFPAVRENAEWEQYYKQQKIVPPGWPIFCEGLENAGVRRGGGG